MRTLNGGSVKTAATLTAGGQPKEQVLVARVATGDQMPSCTPDIADLGHLAGLRRQIARRDLLDRVAGGLADRQCHIDLDRVEAREVKIDAELDQLSELGAQFIVVPCCLLRDAIEREA